MTFDLTDLRHPAGTHLRGVQLCTDLKTQQDSDPPKKTPHQASFKTHRDHAMLTLTFDLSDLRQPKARTIILNRQAVHPSSDPTSRPLSTNFMPSFGPSRNQSTNPSGRQRNDVPA
ncbi:hypothetical protein ACFPK9_15565 [Rubritalea spongiae]|uniref:Uncharacterized protein n=1 Tax=Rubritalea spongiae TaxID=430797 RepID=A0ABW5DXF4_9BACT